MTLKMNDLILHFVFKNKVVVFLWILFTFLLYPIHHVIIPKYYGLVINSFKDKSNKFLNLVKYLVLFYVSAMAIESTLFYCTKIIAPNFGEYATSTMYNYIIDHYEMDFDNIHSGEILSKITYISTIFFSYLETLRTLLFSQFFVFVSTLYHYWYVSNEVFTFFIFAIIVNVLYIYNVFYIKFKVDLVLYDQRSKLFEYMNDSMLNLVSIYSTNNEENEKNKFIDEEYKIYKDSETASLDIYFASETIWNVVCVFIFIILNYLIYNSYLKKQINVEKLVSTFTLTFSVLRFYENAPHIIKKLSKLYSEIGDVENFFIEINKLNQTSKTDTKGFANGDIIYSNVYHKYKDTFVLNNVSFKIEKGEKVAFVGHIGSGKSTAVKLLLGFQPLTMGNITINGVGINEISNHQLRKNVFYIPQKPKLFNRTLYENIVYGLEDPPSIDTILTLLDELNMKDVFMEKMNKKVGLDGNSLSGGQKQIVWLLRSFYRKSKIIVMDEPTASLDQANKELLLKTINKLSVGKTLIIISHDPIDSNFRKIEFKDGKMNESMFF
jgi:ABC-type multidrug transport system fused ATPase/permease subunit